jgi:hypothetical protein
MGGLGGEARQRGAQAARVAGPVSVYPRVRRYDSRRPASRNVPFRSRVARIATTQHEIATEQGRPRPELRPSPTITPRKPRMTRRRTDRPAVVQSQSDIARRRGCARSTVSRACKPGGALFPALVAPDRIDLFHPACQRFLAEVGADAGVLIDETALSPREAAEQKGVSVKTVLADMHGSLAAAVIPIEHVSAGVYALLAQMSVIEVEAAVRGALRPALTASRRIDVGHPASLAFLAAHPFARLPNGDPDAPEGFLAPACVGDDEIDLNHPFARAYFARLDGRVATEAEIDAMSRGAAR